MVYLQHQMQLLRVLSENEIESCDRVMNIYTLKPRQNGGRFSDNILKGLFLNENEWIVIKIALKFVHICPINNVPSLVQIMAWRRPGNKPFSEPCQLVCWRIYVSLNLNELTFSYKQCTRMVWIIWFRLI